MDSKHSNSSTIDVVDIEQVNMEDCYSSSPLTTKALLDSMGQDELKAKVYQTHFTEAIKTIVPSVSKEELAHYERLREQFSSA